MQNYLLELQPDISIKVRSGMTDPRKNYSNKYTCHFCSVCKLEEETIHNLAACNVDMLYEDFRKCMEIKVVILS